MFRAASVWAWEWDGGGDRGGRIFVEPVEFLSLVLPLAATLWVGSTSPSRVALLRDRYGLPRRKSPPPGYFAETFRDATGEERRKATARPTVKEILEDYRFLDETDIRPCIAYGAGMACERYVDVPLVKTS